MTGRLRSIATVVDDMAQTLAFYRTLGMDIPPSADTEEHVTVELGSGIRMSWVTVEAERSFNPDWEAPVQAGRMGVTFEYKSPEEVDTTHEQIVADGHPSPLPPFDAPWGNRHCRLLDPDGNAVDLFAERLSNLR